MPRYAPTSAMFSASSLSSSPRFVRLLFTFNVLLTIALLSLGYTFITSSSSSSSTTTTSLTPSSSTPHSTTYLPLIRGSTDSSLLSPSFPSSLSSSSLLPSNWSGLATLHHYAKFHSLSLSSSSIPSVNPFSSSSPPRYLIWRMRDYTGAGFGNRLIGALTGLYLAMTTQRIFLLTDDKLEAALRPNAIDYRDSSSLARKATLHIQLPLNVQNELGCEDLTEKWKGHEVITMETTQYFLPLLSHNPHFREWSDKLFGSDRSVFAQHLLAFLFLPSSTLEDLVLNFARENHFRAMQLDPYKEVGWSGRTWKIAEGGEAAEEVVGLQVRREHMYEADRESAVFMQCALAIHSSSSSSAPLRVFIATDDMSSTLSIAQRLLPPSTSLLHYSGPHAALVDLYLLSLTNHLIITWPRSTFGSVAVALAGHPPYTVHSSRGLRGVCTKQVSSEPCFHGWYRRRDLRCWSEETHETYEMLNFDNCYQCNVKGGCAEGMDAPSDISCPFGKCPPKYDR